MKKRRYLLLSALLVLFIDIAPLQADATLPKGLRAYAPGPAPLFKLADMDGESFALDTARGRWVFVHFWASWCGPCRKEMPAVQRMAARLQDDPLLVVMVNTSEDEDTVFSFLGSYAPDMNSLMDSDGQVTEAWQPRGLPATYLVDPQGNIRYQALGGRPWDQPEYLEFLRSLSRQTGSN
ncbi:MAG: TlpA family protein disulfide reductase [Thiogranum sp.]